MTDSAAVSEHGRAGTSPVRDAATTFAIRVASAGLLFGLQVLLARLMPLSGYGGFVTLWTWMLALGSVGSLGLAEASVRFLPRYLARGREGVAGRYFVSGFRVVCGASLALAAMGVAASLLVSGEVALIVLLVALSLPFLAMENYLEGVARGFGWYRLTTVPVYIVRPVLIGGAVLVLAAFGVELTLPVVGLTVLGAVATVTVGLAVYLWWRLRAHRGAGGARAGETRLWVRAALPLVLVSSLEDLMTYADVLLISLLLPADDVGVYFAAARVLALANFVYFAMYLVSARQFALDLAARDRGRLQASLLESSRLTFWLTGISLAATLLAGPYLLAAFGSDFSAGYPVMAVLAIGMMARAVSGQAAELLVVSGRNRQAVFVLALTFGTNIALSLALIPIFGIVGAAIGTAVAMAVRTLAITMLVRRTEGLRIIAVGLPRLSLART